MPTPAVNDMGAGYSPAQWDDWAATMKEKHGNGNGQGRSLSIEARRDAGEHGPYAEAIKTWESVTGRAAPSMVDDKGRLSAAFAEFMMGLPAGWITDVPGVTRSEALKMAGNGVVPQQAALALSRLASWAVQ